MDCLFGVSVGVGPSAAATDVDAHGVVGVASSLEQSINKMNECKPSNELKKAACILKDAREAVTAVADEAKNNNVTIDKQEKPNTGTSTSLVR